MKAYKKRPRGFQVRTCQPALAGRIRGWREEQQDLSRLEVDALRRDVHRPDVVEDAVLWLDVLEQRHVVQLLVVVGREVPDLAGAADVQAPVGVPGNGANNAVRRGPYQPPRRAVVLERAEVVSHVHQPARVLGEHPVLGGRAVLTRSRSR